MERKILFLYPPYFYDNHLVIFTKYIHLFGTYDYTVVIKSVDGFDVIHKSRKAIEEIQKEAYSFVFLGNKKHYGLIEPNERVFFIEADTTEYEMIEVHKKILRQRKIKGTL